ncbi:aspartate aminotransferase family protein [Novosphingobium piscinae]|uniref:Aminotransferase class III-fold pyridoxal phosphate-dependent enzyme n=1 Tax=Novosphingobium piscinae TaxID=1507448 RepID=A0A7X1FYK5_9SPHN|nr:aminotransferase class III-fold pyridoxal phosphate-dependent enzyme [Novosphingobium piscinae]MBC2669286.1 aminotransferase class III-fold pyridoxal phosphate-dependent enzyme [Novosphingobium piscinae]
MTHHFKVSRCVETALEEAESLYRSLHPASAAHSAHAAQFMPGGNTRSSLWAFPFPIYMEGGHEARLTDVDGNVYIDFLGEFTSGIYGHSPDFLKDALVSATDRGVSLSSHHRLEGELAERLCQRFPSVDMVRFCNSGTEANIMAINAALTFTGREEVVVFQGAYHGSVLTFSGNNDVNVPFKTIILPYNDIEALLATFAGRADQIAAIIVEPMLGAGGCTPGTAEFLSTCRELCSDSGAVLIFDEVQTARLHFGGRQSQLGIFPDLTVVGKFFGGSLPFGCFGGRKDIMQQFDPRAVGAIAHAGTFNNNTLTMAAGIAAIDQHLTAEALDQLSARGDRLRTEINAVFERQGAPYHATGIGSIMNIHPNHGPDSKYLRQLIYLDLINSGIFVAARGLISLCFSINDDDIVTFVQKLKFFTEQRSVCWS